MSDPGRLAALDPTGLDDDDAASMRILGDELVQGRSLTEAMATTGRPSNPHARVRGR